MVSRAVVFLLGPFKGNVQAGETWPDVLRIMKERR